MAEDPSEIHCVPNEQEPLPETTTAILFSSFHFHVIVPSVFGQKEHQEPPQSPLPQHPVALYPVHLYRIPSETATGLSAVIVTWTWYPSLSVRAVY